MPLVYARRGPVASRDHAHLFKSREARWTTYVVDSGRPRSSATVFTASSRAGHTCRHVMARLRDVEPGDIETTTDALGNLHQRCRPIEKASPDTIDNGSALTPTTSLHRATSGQPWMSSAMAPTAYTPMMPPHQVGEPDAIHKGMYNPQTEVICKRLEFIV